MTYYGWPKEELRILSGKRWKMIARKLRSKYRTELAMERAKHQATKEALIAMVRELADTIGQVKDEEWDESQPEATTEDKEKLS